MLMTLRSFSIQNMYRWVTKLPMLSVLTYWIQCQLEHGRSQVTCNISGKVGFYLFLRMRRTCLGLIFWAKSLSIQTSIVYMVLTIANSILGWRYTVFFVIFWFVFFLFLFFYFYFYRIWIDSLLRNPRPPDGHAEIVQHPTVTSCIFHFVLKSVLLIFIDF